MFQETVNLNNREDMLEYLKTHFRYYTMHSWNRATSYAHNVKIPNLNIPYEHQDVAYHLAYGALVSEELDTQREILFRDFTMRTGFQIAFNGRSSGYLVLYETEMDYDGNRQVFPGRSIDADPDELDEMSDDMLKCRVETVMKFDETVSQYRDIFANICKKYTENPPTRVPVQRVEHLYDFVPSEN